MERDLEKDLTLIGIIFLIVMALWISSWPIFDEKTSSAFETIDVAGEIIVQYQVSGTQILASYIAPIYKEVITHTTWYGRKLYDQCVLDTPDQNVVDEFGYITSTAEATLSSNGLPFDYEMLGLNQLDGDGVDCTKASIDFDVYIRLSGNFVREGDYLLLRRETYIDYEWAWIKIPARLYDEILMSAIDHRTFSLSEFASPVTIEVASYIVKEGDPSGLVGWINSHMSLVMQIYGKSPVHESGPAVLDIITQRKVVTGWHKKRDCNYRGVCSSEIVTDTKKVSEINAVNVIVGNFIIE